MRKWGLENYAAVRYNGGGVTTQTLINSTALLTATCFALLYIDLDRKECTYFYRFICKLGSSAEFFELITL